MHKSPVNPISNHLIWGAGGHARSVLNILNENGVFDIQVLDKGKEDDLSKEIKALSYLGVGDNLVRKKIFQETKDSFPNISFPSLVSGKAYVAENVELGEGSIIFPGAIVNAGVKIGKGCVVNCGAVIEHDCILEDYSFVASGSVLGGAVVLSELVHVGLNVTINPTLSIGSNSLVGSGSVVTKNLDADSLFYGVPAKKIKSRESNEPFL